MNPRDLIWPGICFALTGAPLAVALIIAPPEASDLPRALWETVLLSGAGLLSGYAILRLTPRRWVRVVGVLTVPVGLVLYAMLDSEGASVQLSQAMAPEGKRLRSIVYPDNPLHTAISWFFLHVPLARSLVVLVIPALVAVVVFGLESVRQRGSRSSALQRNRRQAIEGLMARFHLDHADWIVDGISTPKQALVAQIPIVLAGLYFDIVENRKLSISRPRFFQLVRDSLEGVEGIVTRGEEVGDGLDQAPVGEGTANRVALLVIHERIPETMATARESGVPAATWLNLWRQVVERFEQTTSH